MGEVAACVERRGAFVGMMANASRRAQVMRRVLAGAALVLLPAVAAAQKIGINVNPPQHWLDIYGGGADDDLRDLNIYHEVTTGSGLTSTGFRPVYLEGNLRALDLPPTAVPYLGLTSTFYYGGYGAPWEPPIPARGTAHAATLGGIIVGSGHANNEQAAVHAGLRYDIGAGYSHLTTPGRAWVQDLALHSAIRVRHAMLSGVTQFFNKYFDGPPALSESYAFAAVTKPGTGGFGDAIHAAAATYPIDLGFGVYGAASGGARGWHTAFRAGGTGSNWGVTSSRIGTGFHARDVDANGVLLDHAYPGTRPTGLAFGPGGQWGWFLDMAAAAPPAFGAMRLVGNVVWTTPGTIGTAAGGRPKALYVTDDVRVGDDAVVLHGNAVTMKPVVGPRGAPGANLCAQYWRPGTQPATMRMVVRCGASGPEVTVVDNIPTR